MPHDNELRNDIVDDSASTMVRVIQRNDIVRAGHVNLRRYRHSVVEFHCRSFIVEDVVA